MTGVKALISILSAKGIFCHGNVNFPINIVGYSCVHYITYKMYQQKTNLIAKKLYKEAFNQFDWEKVLPPAVYKYHELIFKETNAVIDLQMGTVLPFITYCLGPNTKRLFFTCVTNLNLF